MSCIQEIILESNSEIQELIDAIANTTKLSAMMLIALKIGCLIAVKLVEKVLAERADRLCSWPRCPECGVRIENKGRQKRQIRGIIGIVRWRRKIGTCPNDCEIDQIAPFDEELGLKPNQRISSELKQIGCALAIFVPYQTAATLLKLLTGVTVCPMTIWNWVQEAGFKGRDDREEKIHAFEAGERPEEELIEPEIADMPMVIGGDGVLVPFRPYEATPEGETTWYQVNVGVVTRVANTTNQSGQPISKLVRRRLVAVLEDTASFASHIEFEAIKQGVESAETVAWISDGARGFWNVFRLCFSCFVGILDFYHAAQNIWKASKVWLDGRTQISRQWFAELRHLLRHGNREEFMSAIIDAMLSENLSETAANALENLYSYFQTHYQHIDYMRFKDDGLPIGSGMVESACKWLVQQRFKVVGARWSVHGFNNLLFLRVAWVNENFEQHFM